MMVMNLLIDVLTKAGLLEILVSIRLEEIHMAIQVTTNRAGATLVHRGMVVGIAAVLGKRGTKSLLRIRIAAWDPRRVMRSVLRR
jgi:hypothetical protein